MTKTTKGAKGTKKAAPTMTALERRLLTQIRDSEYHDGSDPVDHEVWRSIACEGFKGKQVNGVLSSLAKKGWAKTQEDGKDEEGRDESVVWITRAGFDALAATDTSTTSAAPKAGAAKEPKAKKERAPKAAAPAKTPKERDARIPPAGTKLTREYKGKTIEVLVRETDFEHKGESFSSLSALATKLADGSPKNGLLWFGLTKRELPKVDPADADADAKNHFRKEKQDAAAKRTKRSAKTKRAGRDPAAVDAPAIAEGVDAPAPDLMS